MNQRRSAAITAMMMAGALALPFNAPNYERIDETEKRRKAERELSNSFAAERRAKAEAKRCRRMALRSSRVDGEKE